MYSGQEIVSQEECKIVLAEFYEGVDCYNKTDNTIKFTLQDWATATFSGDTLHTKYFSCRPLSITGEITHMLIADIPDGTTGLEVHMHTAEYNRTRIMPLMYLRECNSWNPPAEDNPYINEACNTPTNTTLVIEGIVDSVTSNSIVVVGYSDSLENGSLTLQFLDSSDNIMLINPSFSTEMRDISEWKYNENTKQYEEIIISKEVVLVTLELAKNIQTTGTYETTYLLYDCDNPNPFGDITEFCNETYPQYRTRITATSSEYEYTHDGWFKIGTTKFKLLPTMEFIQFSGMYYFKGAKVILFEDGNDYDIYECTDNPSEEFTFDTYEYFEGTQLWLELILTGYYIIENNCVIDMTTQDTYCFFSDKTSVPIPIEAIKTKVLIDCHTYYRVNNEVRIETPLRGSKPISNDPRVVWSEEKCKFIVTCESIGAYDCSTCIDCSNQPDGESAHLYSHNPSEICTNTGIKQEREYVSACEGNIDCALGEIPSLSIAYTELPTPLAETADYIYIAGSQMYMEVQGFGFIYTVYLGDLSAGVTLKDIVDDATNTSKQALFVPFLYLSVFNLPFEYVKSYSLNQDIWYDENITISHDISRSNGYDFKIPTSTLKGLLVEEWQDQYNWHGPCSWLSAKLVRTNTNYDKIITVNNTSEVDKITCEDNAHVTYNSSNVPFLQANLMPAAGYGAYQEAYNKYASDINMLITPEAEAYAYSSGIYDQKLP